MSFGATDDVRAVAAALQPYPWRSYQPRRLARVVVAAADRHGLTVVLMAVTGTVPGVWSPLEPVASDDPRVCLLVDWLESHSRSGLNLDRMCACLLDVLRGVRQPD